MTITLEASHCQRLQTVLELEVENGSWRYGRVPQGRMAAGCSQPMFMVCTTVCLSRDGSEFKTTDTGGGANGSVLRVLPVLPDDQG